MNLPGRDNLPNASIQRILDIIAGRTTLDQAAKQSQMPTSVLQEQLNRFLKAGGEAIHTPASHQSFWMPILSNTTDAICRLDFSPPLSLASPHEEQLQTLLHTPLAFANEAYKRLFPCSPNTSNTLHQQAETHFDQAGRESHRKTLLKLIQNRYQLPPTRSLRRTQKGSLTWTHESGVGIVQEEHLSQLWICLQNTADHQDHTPLNEGSQRLLEFMGQSNDIIFYAKLPAPLTWNTTPQTLAATFSQCTLELCNQPAASYFEHHHTKDILHHPIGNLYKQRRAEPCPKTLNTAAQAFLDEGFSLKNYEYIEKRKDASERIFTCSALGNLRNGELQGAWITLRDQTTARQNSKERELMERRLQHAERMESVGKLAGGVAHDFNNMLMAILGYAELMLIDPEDAEQTTEAATEIRSAGKRAAELTRQLLTFSKKQPMRKTSLNINERLGELHQILKRTLPASIEVDIIPGHQLGTIEADPARFDQIILNLALNAREAMHAGGRLTVESQNVRINGEYCRHYPWARPGRYVLLTVSDTGTGIPPEYLERIFEPFFTTKTRETNNTGFGLATVYGIVQQHNGMINVYSELDIGTTFKIYLPVVERSATSIGPSVERRVRGGQETVLIAEDEPQVRRLVARVLERAGYSVVVARDGEEAIQRFSAAPDRFDLALLDVVMPKMSGQDVQEIISKIRPDLPVLFSSGYTGSILSANVLERGENHLLMKPYDPDELLFAVRNILDTSHVPLHKRS